MKRVIGSIMLLFLMLFLSAAAETVINTPYAYTVEMITFEGLYTGEYEQDLPHGFGLFIAMEGDTVLWHYIGQWENGLPEGEGAVYHENGTVEKGTFAQGVLQKEVPADAPNAASENEYIGNVKTRAFHLPTCASVSEMKPENRTTLESREEAIRQGYHPCGRCKP